LVEKEYTKDGEFRTLPLLDNVRAYLLKLKSQETENQLLMGEGYTKNDYVCKWDDGRQFAPAYVSKAFKNLLLKNGMTVIRFHDLRHTCASLLIAMGFSLKEVGEWLGHKDISTTNIYAHLLYDSKISMGDKLNSAIKLVI